MLFFTKECHLLSEKLESMEIKSPSGFNDKPDGACLRVDDTFMKISYIQGHVNY